VRRRARALIAAAAVAAGLAGCNGNFPEAQVAPFKVLGDYTGAHWRAIGPALGGVLKPTSANVCERGAPACMDAVVAEMSRRISALGCSHLAPFATMYRQVSIEVKRAVDAGQYTDPAYVAHLDSVFATYYFHALDEWRTGHRNAVPRAWQMAFSAAQNRKVSTFGDLLLGMNAHISRDLPYALYSVGLRYPNGRSAVADVVAVNKAIQASQAPMLALVRRHYDPKVGPPPGLPPWLTGDVPRIIAAWRLEALANARELLDAHSTAERVQIETRIDATAALRSLLIWRATAYPHPAQDTLARDHYCAAQG
jgi:Family of unknown function (DUF5995)